MIRHLTRGLLSLTAAAALTAIGTTPAHAAGASCSGNLKVSAGTTGVTVTGSVTCADLTALTLNTSVTAAGLTSTVTNLLTALPDTGLPVNTTVPALGVTAACSVLLDTSTGVTVTGACGV